MPTIKPTHSAIKAARSPKGKRTFYSIEGHPGLYLRVGARSRSWMLRSEADGRTRWTVIGDHPTMPFQDAVTAVAKLRATAKGSANPIEAERFRRKEEHRRKLELAEYTLAEFAPTVLGKPLSERRSQMGAKRSAPVERRLFATHVEPMLGELKLREIRTGHIAKLRESIAAPSTARKVIAMLRSVLSHALSEGHVDANVAIGVKTTPAGSRSRVLSDAELKAFWTGTAKAIPGVRNSLRDALRLQLLLALRAKEAASLRWIDVDLDDGVLTIPAEVAKNGKAHTLPLPRQALEVLGSQDRDGELVFPARRSHGPTRTDTMAKVLTKIRSELALTEQFGTHDLRRTAATRLAGLGIAPHVIERILNHLSGVFAGTHRTYNRYSYEESMAHALQGWADELDRLAIGAAGDGKVVKIGRSR